MFERNVGGTDRQLRFLLGGLLLLVGGVALGTAALDRTVGVLAVAGGVGLLANAVTQRCLMNRLFGIDTCGEDC
jgi:hypothetical protein